MLVVVDVGNSNTVVGVWEGERLMRRWRVSTVAERTPDEYVLLLAALLGEELHPRGAALSSVVPPAVTALRSALGSVVDGPLVVVGPGVRTGLPILIDNPREVGADRVVNAIGALDRHGAPVVVVDFGTATTVDLVDGDGAYRGGVIAPGVRVAGEALVEHTAALRRVELTTPRHVVGRSTVEAIQSGLVFGFAALVDGLVDRICEEHELEGVTVVATGGMGDEVIPHCRRVGVVDEDLTLLGLRLVFERNVG